MDRHGFVEEETDARSRSIGRRNLRAKLREQLKGYSNVRGFPLDQEESKEKVVDRTESLTARRDSLRRRGSSVTRQQQAYDSDADDFKYRPRARKSTEKESLLVPRLLWLSVYIALCYSAYRGVQYFTSEPQVSLCEFCPDQKCGVLDDDFVFPLDDVPEVPFGTTFNKNSRLQCRAEMCVPSEVAEPSRFCKVVTDVALLAKTRRLLTISGTPEEKSARFAEYFQRRSLQEANGLAQSPNQPVATPTPSQTQTAKTPAPAVAPSPTSSMSASLANGGRYPDPNIPKIDFRTLAANAWEGGGNCSTLIYAPADGDGYANITTNYYALYTYVTNYEQCCGLCYNDPLCQGWTRVAGGDSTVLNCYLSKTVTTASIDPYVYNWQPAMPAALPLYVNDPNVRYTGNVPIMLESGTFRTPTNMIHELLYGCPYPPAADGSCPIPNQCNCGGGTCYTDPCISPQSRTRIEPVYRPYQQI